MTPLPHGPYEAGDVIYLVHTAKSTGATSIGPLAVECCIPLQDCLHWRVEYRDEGTLRSVIVGWDGLAADGSVHRQDDEDPVVIIDTRSQVVRAALNLAAVEWDNGRQTAEHSMHLDMAHDQLDEALAAYVSVINAARAGVIPT